MVVRWLRSVLSSSKKLVGRDHFGNSYYEVVKGSNKVQRSFEASGATSHENYQTGNIPHEWEAWLRGKRSNPPLEEEIEKNLKYTTQVQLKAARKTKEDDERQAQAYADGLIARETPIQNSTVGTPTSQPGTDANFQPDAWTPGNSNDANARKDNQQQKYEPDSWKPGQ